MCPMQRLANMYWRMFWACRFLKMFGVAGTTPKYWTTIADNQQTMGHNERAASWGVVSSVKCVCRLCKSGPGIPTAHGLVANGDRSRGTASYVLLHFHWLCPIKFIMFFWSMWGLLHTSTARIGGITKTMYVTKKNPFHVFFSSAQCKTHTQVA